MGSRIWRFRLSEHMRFERIEVRMTQKCLALFLVAAGLFGVGVPSGASFERVMLVAAGLSRSGA